MIRSASTRSIRPSYEVSARPTWGRSALPVQRFWTVASPTLPCAQLQRRLASRPRSQDLGSCSRSTTTRRAKGRAEVLRFASRRHMEKHSPPTEPAEAHFVDSEADCSTHRAAMPRAPRLLIRHSPEARTTRRADEVASRTGASQEAPNQDGACLGGALRRRRSAPAQSEAACWRCVPCRGSMRLSLRRSRSPPRACRPLPSLSNRRP